MRRIFLIALREAKALSRLAGYRQLISLTLAIQGMRTALSEHLGTRCSIRTIKDEPKADEDQQHTR